MRALFLFLSRQEAFKRFCLRFEIFRNTAWRFVAGETLDDAIRAVRAANRFRMHASLDHLGENVHARDGAERATAEIVEMLDRIDAEKVDCNVSVKLTQLGLDLDTELCAGNLLRIVEHAARYGNFVRVDMEDSRYTERTLDLVRRTRAARDNVGAVIQAYLYRSERDVDALLEARTRIRLCKGAYLEPESVAFKDKRDTDANFVRLMKKLLQSGIYHGIATHDPAMIAATRKFASERGIAKDAFEFQMLFGVRRDLQRRLAREGFHVRIYIPYGRQWYPYFMRRLAERPANVAFILRNLFRE
jgi:proline dehydrogenase